MELTRSHRCTIRERLRRDPELRKEMLLAVVECLHGGEISIAKSILLDCVAVITGFERLGALMGKSEASLREMLHPDYDTCANDIFEIIHHVSKHEGLRLEVSAQLADAAEQVSSDTAPPEMASVADG